MITYTAKERADWFDGLHKRASAAGIMCETADGRLLIVKANYKPHWTIPGGLIDPGETPLEGAIRETVEEVGIDVSSDRASFVYVANRQSEFAHTYQFVFHTIVSDEEIASIKLQASEIDEYDLVTKETVLSNDRYYGKAIRNWAEDITGYTEQDLSEKG